MKHSIFGAMLCLTITGGVTATEETIASSHTALSPKGIYHAVDEYQRTGIKFLVELNERGEKPRPVAVTHGFETGDRFTFRFEINRDSYIYIINQTLRDATTVFPRKTVSPRKTSSALRTTSSGLKSKGVERVYDKPRPAVAPQHAPLVLRSKYAGKPRLLFPTTRAGLGNRLRKDHLYPLPERGHYVMDDLTGTEKLYVVVSDRKLDMSSFFHRDSGRARGTSSTERLRRQLEKWKKNAQIELVDKGIVHEVASYGVSIDPSEPAMIEIDLRHCR